MTKLLTDLIKWSIVEEKQLVVFHFATVCNMGCNHGILNLKLNVYIQNAMAAKIFGTFL